MRYSRKFLRVKHQPGLSDELIIAATAAAKQLASSPRIFWEIPSGPADLFIV